MNTNRPVALVDDGELLDDVLKLAAAAGCQVERLPDATAVRQHWNTAPLLILDASGVRECVELRLPRRGSVLVVTATQPSEELWRDAVAVGARHVVELPGGEEWLVSALADAAEAPAGSSGRVLSVLGGRGGAGASVFAASVGLTVLRNGDGALLIDCDPLGGGLDLVLGAETEQGLRWPELRLRAGRVSASSLHSALPGRTHGNGRLTLLSGAREGVGPEPDAVAAVLEAGSRAGETVICDLSREFGDAARAALERSDLAVIVVPAEVRACVSAKLVADRVREHGITARLVVRGPAPGGLRAGEVANVVGIPLLTSMRPEPALARSLDQGNFRPKPRGPLAGAARATLKALAAVPARDLRAAS
ncbi:MAG TPA: septum site-determining protein Ssd [Actinophytocola sp.]|uniref:septum site-determining protein Ssd n=1 Tax=Actinophytocola sp. TaxID=1872138 RepID=UPI002DDD2AAC|nr:septum site-determining protein Ssd [Actinophytocola sp.]HEV2782474.1 septum site-determining protein Ssd [Actinophytocola sp.]